MDSDVHSRFLQSGVLPQLEKNLTYVMGNRKRALNFEEESFANNRELAQSSDAFN